MSWRASILTLYPEMFPGPLGHSLVGDALRAGVWSLDAANIREQGIGRHRRVDDTPAGGGPGMVIRCDVAAAAIDAAWPPPDKRPRLVMSPRGKPIRQSFIRELVAGQGVAIFCGRFEGIDERVIAARQLTEVSLGDVVLAGGEIAAMALIEACVRLLPGVMGKQDSAAEESFEAGLLEYPQFTRPREWQGRAIPEVLLSGDHARIAAWRRAEALRLTRERRPDLIEGRSAASRRLERDREVSVRLPLILHFEEDAQAPQRLRLKRSRARTEPARRAWREIRGGAMPGSPGRLDHHRALQAGARRDEDAVARRRLRGSLDRMRPYFRRWHGHETGGDLDLLLDVGRDALSRVDRLLESWRLMAHL
mgnify:CR=1 FL=1